MFDSKPCEWRDLPEVVDGWRLSRHARQAIVDRGFRLEDVRAALSDPRQTYTAFDYGFDRWVYQRDHLSVVVVRETRVVITVLLRSWAKWTDDDARSANGVPAA